MSVFGGDSWAREAQYKKRRVDELLIDGFDSSSYKKLSSGKFACLVCPNNPVLDTPLMLSMHVKGSRHRVAESKLKERELSRQDEINKRIALSDGSITIACNGTSAQQHSWASKPLIERTRKAALEKQLVRKLCRGNQIFENIEKENSSSLLLVGSVTAMGGGSEMKMLSLTLTKKIQTSALHDEQVESSHKFSACHAEAMLARSIDEELVQQNFGHA